MKAYIFYFFRMFILCLFPGEEKNCTIWKIAENPEKKHQKSHSISQINTNPDTVMNEFQAAKQIIFVMKKEYEEVNEINIDIKPVEFN